MGAIIVTRLDSIDGVPVEKRMQNQMWKFAALSTLIIS